jgi:hypothetical protein
VSLRNAPCRAAYARQARNLGVVRLGCKLHARQGVSLLGNAPRRAAFARQARNLAGCSCLPSNHHFRQCQSTDSHKIFIRETVKLFQKRELIND